MILNFLTGIWLVGSLCFTLIVFLAEPQPYERVGWYAAAIFWPIVCVAVIVFITVSYYRSEKEWTD